MAQKLQPPVSSSDHLFGARDAQVVLVEYSDFECEHCAEAQPLVKDLMRKYSQQLAIVFRHFPLTQLHPHAKLAAASAEAAGLQGEFWAMHDIMFQHQDALEPEDLLEYAGVLGLDAQAFAADMQDETVTRHVNTDFLSGVRSGVNGTPSFYLNGYKWEGDWRSGVLERDVVAMLQRGQPRAR